MPTLLNGNNFLLKRQKSSNNPQSHICVKIKVHQFLGISQRAHQRYPRTILYRFIGIEQRVMNVIHSLVAIADWYRSDSG